MWSGGGSEEDFQKICSSELEMILTQVSREALNRTMNKTHDTGSTLVVLSKKDE
jgi:hypothetical protein